MSGLAAPVATLPAAAHLAALAGLPDVGPARLAALLARGEPPEVLAALAAGSVEPDEALAAACRRADPTPLLRAWSVAAAAVDVRALWERHRQLGVVVLTPADDAWPPSLAGDPEPPAVLFGRGEVTAAAHRPAVAVVGTRRCTRYGWDVAHDLGVELRAAGVAVVSGLARGVDAAAHRGAVGGEGAPPIGVVATGLDVAYPTGNRGLWDEVAGSGCLLSEAPLGTPPARWRFPARNRIIAALADAVVVVESAAAGGALHTVDEALDRGRPVFAVPGPITSPASAGTNRLLAEVAHPLCDVDDVLLAVGARRRPAVAVVAAAVPGDAESLRVLDAVGWTPATLDAVAAASGLDLGRAAATLARLLAAGAVADLGGAWQRTGVAP